jgi:hypothetical protein
VKYKIPESLRQKVPADKLQEFVKLVEYYEQSFPGFNEQTFKDMCDSFEGAMALIESTRAQMKAIREEQAAIVTGKTLVKA